MEKACPWRSMTKLDSDIICHTVMGKPVKPKTMGQQKYVKAIDEKMIVFASAGRNRKDVSCHGKGDHCL